MMVLLHIHLLLSFFPFPSLIFQSAWHFAFECLYHRVHLPCVCFATFWGGLLSSQFIFFSTALFVDHLLCFCYLTCLLHMWSCLSLGLPCISHQASLMSLLCTPHCKQYGCSGNCRLPHFFVLGVLVIGFHEDLLYGGVAFEVSLYATLTTYVFETFC